MRLKAVQAEFIPHPDYEESAGLALRGWDSVLGEVADILVLEDSLREVLKAQVLKASGADTETRKELVRMQYIREFYPEDYTTFIDIRGGAQRAAVVPPKRPVPAKPDPQRPPPNRRDGGGGGGGGGGGARGARGARGDRGGRGGRGGGREDRGANRNRGNRARQEDAFDAAIEQGAQGDPDGE
jgi:hypothetical protein